jgi:saposin
MARAALLFCGLLAAVASAAPVITSANNPHFRALRPEPAQNQSPCDYCQDVVKTLDEFVSDPQTQQTISKYIEAAACAGLPDNFKQMCKQEVPVLVASFAQSLSEALDPQGVCGLLGVCHGGKDLAQVTPFDCPVCRVAVQMFVARLQDKEARAQVEGVMRAACAASNLPPEGKAKCDSDVTDLFSALDGLLHDVDAEGVCAVFDFCAQPQGSRPAPEALRTLRSTLSALGSGMPAVDAAPLRDQCQSCKTIVMEAAAILQDPKTQAELLEYAKQGCTIFQDFKDQCEAYVTLYGPLVFNMLISYLQPDFLCARLGYCPVGPPPMVVS